MKPTPIRSHIKRWLLLTPVVAQWGCNVRPTCSGPIPDRHETTTASAFRFADGGPNGRGSSPDGGALPETITADNCRAFCEAAFGFGFVSCTVGVADGGEATAECVIHGTCTGRRPAGFAEMSGARSNSRVGAYLAASAQLELASVPAFVRLGRELREHGAPARLVRATERAARDEVRHARVMAQLAHEAGGQPTIPEVTAVGPRTLEMVLTENRIEGCIHETFGALIGARQARLAQLPEVRRAMTSIAKDEAFHAELSWEIARWGEPKLSTSAQRRIAARARAAVKTLGQSLSRVASSEVREALGLPDADEARALHAAVRRELWS